MKMNTVKIETITTINGEVVKHSIAYVSPLYALLHRFWCGFNRFLGCLYVESGLKKLIHRLINIQAA
ncbi:MAG: hypothetical protein IKZ88_08090 [Neisseriaceae bacterium]|nr:hypothetical protein [Neisseriaceae bacterium]